MARHSITFTAKGPSVFRNVRRDSAGIPLVLIDAGETRKIELDYSAMLESSETLTSATVSATGITAAISTSGAIATLTLSSPSAWGEAAVTATLSGGDVVKATIRARESASTYDPAEIAYAL